MLYSNLYLFALKFFRSNFIGNSHVKKISRHFLSLVQILFYFANKCFLRALFNLICLFNPLNSPIIKLIANFNGIKYISNLGLKITKSYLLLVTLNVYFVFRTS